MAAPVLLRAGFDAVYLRGLAKRSSDPGQIRRLLALEVICEGGSRADAARMGAVGLQMVRNWVLRFNAEGPEGLVTGKAPGARPLPNSEQRQALQRIIDEGPIPSVHGVVRWRLVDLIAWVWEAFRIPISKQTLSRELRTLGDRKLSAHPRHHAKNEAAVSAFKKTSPPRKTSPPSWRRSPRQSAASRSRSGSGMRPGRGRRIRSPGDEARAGHAPRSAQGPEDSVGLHLRRHLPGARHNRGHELAPEGNRASRRARGSCPRPARPSGLASVEEAGGPGQHHPHAAPSQGTRVEPPREGLAVPARELASVMGRPESIPSFNLAASYLLPSVVGALAAT